MSETVTDAPTAPADAPAQDDKPAKPETDWKAEAKKWESRAKENKTAADRLAQIEEANKTEAQKNADRLAAAETEAAQARSEALRFKVAAKYQIGDEDAELFLTGTDEDVLVRQAQRLTAREAERKKQGNYVPREGTTPTTTGGDERDAARALFGGT